MATAIKVVASATIFDLTVTTTTGTAIAIGTATAVFVLMFTERPTIIL